MSQLSNFERAVQKYYIVENNTCTHSDKNHIVYLHRPADRDYYRDECWTKYTVCQNCADNTISSAHCGGHYINFRLFIGDNDASGKYNLVSKAVEPIPCLMFHTDIDRGWQVLRITIREQDFCNSNYEKFFYNMMDHLCDTLSKQSKTDDLSTVGQNSWERKLLTDGIELLINTDYDKLWKVATCDISDTNESVEVNSLPNLHKLRF